MRPWPVSPRQWQDSQCSLATEDPNPVQRVAEKCWLGDLGQDAIHIDPDAMRAVKVFEDGDVDNGEEDDTATQHDTKRSRFKIAYSSYCRILRMESSRPPLQNMAKINGTYYTALLCQYLPINNRACIWLLLVGKTLKQCKARSIPPAITIYPHLGSSHWPAGRKLEPVLQIKKQSGRLVNVSLKKQDVWWSYRKSGSWRHHVRIVHTK